MLSSVDHAPDSSWKFDADVVECFEDMLARSIPQYEVMRSLVNFLSAKFIAENSTVIDLGCSKGGAISELIDDSRAGVSFIGVEVSESMIRAARERFHCKSNVSILDLDLRTDYPDCKNASVVIANLTIQFTPIEYRQSIIKRVYDSLLPGGAFILVEKILGESAVMNDLLVSEYYRFKADNGYSRESINRKKLSLEGVLVPVTAAWNEDLLKRSGFDELSCFWRFLNFAGWIAIK